MQSLPFIEAWLDVTNLNIPHSLSASSRYQLNLLEHEMASSNDETYSFVSCLSSIRNRRQRTELRSLQSIRTDLTAQWISDVKSLENMISCICGVACQRLAFPVQFSIEMYFWIHAVHWHVCHILPQRTNSIETGDGIAAIKRKAKMNRARNVHYKFICDASQLHCVQFAIRLLLSHLDGNHFSLHSADLADLAAVIRDVAVQFELASFISNISFKPHTNTCW